MPSRCTHGKQTKDPIQSGSWVEVLTLLTAEALAGLMALPGS
jgi:hypothetical protein